MYITPVFFGGSACLAQAITQSMALASMHIGSGPGVVGLSGMQVKPFSPLRSVRMAPAASMAITVAPLPTASGAAFMALATSASSEGPAGLAGAAAAAGFAAGLDLRASAAVAGWRKADIASTARTPPAKWAR